METTVNGVKLFYRDEGQGPAVLLVHGFPVSGEVWLPQLEELSQTCRVVVPDLRGFGNSEVPPGPYTMETHADDLAALLDTLGIERVVLGGLSMGGYIAFAFLRRHAARLCGLVLCDTRATADTDEVRANRETTARLVEEQGATAIADRMIPNLLSSTAPPERKALLRGIIERNQPQAIAAALRGMALRGDSTDLLPTVSVPTLIVVGEDDVLSTPDEMRGLEAAIPGSKLVVISGAGHIANLDQPALFASALTAFVQQL